MKKAGKFLSYLIILALVVSLMSGLGFKAEAVKADSSTYNVLEIVPDESMGTFGLLIGDNSLLNLGSPQNWADGDVQTFVENFGGSIVTSGGSYTYTCNYFQTLLTNAGITKTVHLDTVMPGNLTNDLIKNADLIVINQTVPSCFSGYTAATFDTGEESEKHRFTKDTALKVFKKIAGLYGNACPYIIDFSMYYSNAGNTTHVLENDMTYKVGTTTKRTRGVLRANQIDDVRKGSENSGSKFESVIGSYKNQGSTRFSYKLLKLLTAIDPSTFYGLFFKETDGSYGFDEDLNQIFEYNTYGTNISSFNLNKGSDAWIEDAIAPWYMDLGSGDIGINAGSGLCSTDGEAGTKMGWFWAGTKTYDNGYQKAISAFGQKIGSGTNKNGETFYNKTNSYFDYLTDISSIVSNYSSHKVDYHPYRYLVVTQNGVDADINRSLVADMVGIANTNNVGLAGGIYIDCMSAYQFANISVELGETYDGICMDTEALALVSDSAGAAKYATYIANDSSDGVAFTATALVNKFSADLTATHKPTSIYYIETPKEYKSQFSVGFEAEGSIGIYSAAEKDTADLTKNKTYINSDNLTYRKLKFDFFIYGNASTDSTYTVKLYVDVNNDDKFKEGERVNSAGKLGSTYTLGEYHHGDEVSVEIPLKDVLTNGNEFAGGFAWKLVVEDSGSARAVSRIGYSALRPDNTEKTLIRILQIYPTDYYKNYTMTESDQSDTTENNITTMSHPNVLLPKTNEVALDNNEVLSLTSDEAIYSYLDGKMTISVATSATDVGGYRKLANVADETLRMNGKNEVNNANYETFRNATVLNSSSLYYYLKLLKNYDVETYRYSVYQFNTKFGGNKDGSETKTNDLSGKQIQEIFYDKTENKFYNYDDKGQKAYFDLLMLGFGSTMDYMESNATEAIEYYIQQYGTALLGYGTISRCKNNTLSAKIKDDIGMTSDTSTGYNLSNEDSAEYSSLMVTNDTILSHYPYSSNYYLKGASQGIGPYTLNVANEDLVVTYAKYNNEGGNPLSYWGYAANNYYLYRLRNVTYCGFGKTRNKASLDQLGGVMTPAEVQIVVNAIITAARLKQSGKAKDPYLKCVDPDRSVLTIKEKEPIKEGEEEKPDNYYILWDSVSTDYDALGMAKVTSGSNLIGDATEDGLITGTYNDANYRTVPYSYTKIAGSGKIVFSLDEARNDKIDSIKVNGTAVTSGVYNMGDSGIYNLSVPLKKTGSLGFDLSSTSSDDQFSFYLTLLNSDDKVLELHKITMVRRVLYPVN